MSIKINNYLAPIAIGVAGIVSSNTISFWRTITNSEALIIILSAITAIIVYELIIFLFNKLPKKFERSRKIIDNRAIYEGFYIEIINVKNIRSYSIVCLTYNITTDEYQLSGVSLGVDGTIGNHWTTNFVKIDTIRKKIIYAQTGHKSHLKNGKIFDGVTYMNFDYNLKGNPNSGVGHFIDTIPAKSDFYFVKITKEDCEKYISKKSIEHFNDYKSFVVEYHKENSDRFFNWEK